MATSSDKPRPLTPDSRSRQRSQILGILVLALVLLLIACIRYYFKLG